MKLLLDTHAFLWFCQGDRRLSATARALIEDAGNLKLVSIASCWEIAIKAGLKKIALGEPSSSYIPTALKSAGFQLLSITVEHATAVEALSAHHRDPFDRLLVAQAMCEQATIISVDPALDPYAINRIW